MGEHPGPSATESAQEGAAGSYACPCESSSVHHPGAVGTPGLTPPRPRQTPVLHRDPQLPSCSPPRSAQPTCLLAGTCEQALPTLQDSQTHASPEPAATSLHAAMPTPGQSLHLLPCKRTQSYIKPNHKTETKQANKKIPQKPEPQNNSFWAKNLTDTSSTNRMLRAGKCKSRAKPARLTGRRQGRSVTFCWRALSRDSTFICSLRSPACSAALSALAFVRTWAISSLALRGGLERRGRGSRLGAARSTAAQR